MGAGMASGWVANLVVPREARFVTPRPAIAIPSAELAPGLVA